MKYGNRNLHWFQAIVDKIGGECEAERFLRGDLKLVEVNPREFSVWRSVTLGLHKTVTSYEKALVSARMKLLPFAEGMGGNLFKDIECSLEKVAINLVVLTVRELGFDEGATWLEISAKGKKLGLNNCPLEVAPALRLQYPDQQSHDKTLFVSGATQARGGSRYVFRLHRDDRGIILSVEYADFNRKFQPEDCFVFVLPQQ